jgi:poly-beta-hydroxyalkanoate depolymerase
MTQVARNALPAHSGIGRCHEHHDSEQENIRAEMHRILDARITPEVVEAVRNHKNREWFDDQLEVLLARIVQIGRS